MARKGGRAAAAAVAAAGRAVVAACTLLAFAPAQAGPAGADGEYFVHQVEPGDTLFWVAQRYTGRADVWRELQALNRVADPYPANAAGLCPDPSPASGRGRGRTRCAGVPYRPA